MLAASLVATTACSQAAPAREPPPTVTPPGAVALFDGSSLDEWVSVRDGSPAQWRLAGGVMTVDKGAGDIQTKQTFQDYQLHLEWRVPTDITGEGELRGNSGLFLAAPNRDQPEYEVQILDSYHNSSKPMGQAGAIYDQHPPLKNPTRKPGEWQVYDVVWRAPRFDRAGQMLTPGRVTVRFNGVVVQDNAEVNGQNPYARAPIRLQAHGDPSPPLSFRNIWVRETGAD